MGNVYGPGTPRLDGDNVIYDRGGLPAHSLAPVRNTGGPEPVLPPPDVEAGGKPSKGTPKDKRLGPNKPAAAPKKAK